MRFVRQPSPATVIASIALFVSLGGVSYGVATGSIDSREIKNNDVRTQDIRNGHVTNRDLAANSVTSPKVKNGSLLSADFRAGQLPAGARGPVGPQGSTGLAGKDGANGANATALYAQIESTAPVAATNQRGVTQIEKLGAPGAYRITFDRNVSQCVPVASISDNPPGSVPPNGQIATNNSAAVPNAVIVATYDATGAAVATKDFTVSVFC